MWLLMWVGAMILTIGALGGVLGALATRAARPGVTPLGEMVSAFLAGRAVSRRGEPKARVPSHG